MSWADLITYNTQKIEKNSNDDCAYYDRGWAYLQLGEYRKAVEDFNKAIALKPDDSEAYTIRGWAYTALGEYKNAIQDFNKVLTLNPEHSEAYEKRSEAYSKILDKNRL